MAWDCRLVVECVLGVPYGLTESHARICAGNYCK